jgi:hypothetical protein
VVTGSQQRAAADHLREAFGVSQRRAAKALGRSRSTVRYQPTALTDENLPGIDFDKTIMIKAGQNTFELVMPEKKVPAEKPTEDGKKDK